MNILFKTPLWEHQKEILESTWQAPAWAFLLAVGTGKSLLTISTLRAIYTKHGKVIPTLLLAPASTLYKWEAEFQKHAGDGTNAHVAVLTGPITKRILQMQTAKILITNYEIFDQDKACAALIKFAPVIVISDELHTIRNHKSKRFRRLLMVSDASKYRRGLTGTPIANSLQDIWAQWRFLDFGESFHTNFFTFRREFFYDKNLGMPAAKHFPDWRPLPHAATEIKRRMLRIASIRTKEECLKLPPTVYTQIPVELSKAQQKAYDEMKRDLITYVDSAASTATIALTKVLRMLQITSGFVQTTEGRAVSFEKIPRIDALTEQLDALIHTNKVIVWAVFQQNYTAIAEVCKSLGTVPVYLTGNESAKEKQASMHAFEHDEKTRVIIANPAAGGTGVDLIAASYNIYYSRNYSFIQRSQSEGRSHRGGSEIHEKITYIDLIARNTIEDAVFYMVLKKEKLSDKIMDIVNSIR